MGRRRGLFDLDTGEVIRELDDGDKVVAKKSVEFLKKQQDKKNKWIREQDGDDIFQVWDVKNWVKGNITELREIHKELSLQERGFLASISLYMNYKHCGICWDNGKALSVENISDICGVNKRQVYSYLNVLMKKDLIGVFITGSVKQYYINPFLYVKGNEINATLKNMFRDYKIRSEKDDVLIRRWDNIDRLV